MEQISNWAVTPKAVFVPLADEEQLKKETEHVSWKLQALFSSNIHCISSDLAGFLAQVHVTRAATNRCYRGCTCILLYTPTLFARLAGLFLLQGKNLEAKDVRIMGKATSDPYAVVKFEGKSNEQYQEISCAHII